MKLKPGFVLREVAGQALVIATGELSKQFKGMIKLNESAKVIWQWLLDGADTSQIPQKLQETYDLEPERARAEADAFLAKLNEAGFLQE